MKNDIAIQVKNVSKKFRVPHRKIDSVRNAFVSIFAPNIYEEFDALKDISFDVKKGEFLGIIGRNGAGKSTLLKTIAGIYHLDGGEISINGRISPFLELGIGFNPELSGRDNVYLNATVLGLAREEIDAKFDEIVQFAELEQFIDQQLKNYSSGMRVRLAFSVSIHANRDILLMDEVLAVGDSRFQAKCLDIFRNYKRQGKTVILVTHSMATVREYCDRALLFNRGELIEAGNVDEVCDEYILKNLSNDERGELEHEEIAQVEEKENFDRIEKKKNEAKVAQLSSLEISDEHITLGSSFEICGEVSFYRDDIDRYDIGIALNNSDGEKVFGCTTVFDGVKFQSEDRRFIARFNNVSLIPGSYTLTVSLFDRVTDQVYDLKRGCLYLVVKPNRVYDFDRYKNGYIDHEWSIEK